MIRTVESSDNDESGRFTQACSVILSYTVGHWLFSAKAVQSTINVGFS